MSKARPLLGQQILVTGPRQETRRIAATLRRAGARVACWSSEPGPGYVDPNDPERAMAMFRKRWGHLHGAVNVGGEEGYVRCQAFKMLETGGGKVISLRGNATTPFAPNGIAILNLDSLVNLVNVLANPSETPVPSWHQNSVKI